MPPFSCNPATESRAEAPSLRSLVVAAGYAECVTAAIERLAASPDPANAQLRLIECTGVLGAEQAFFASFVRDSLERSTCHFMLACDPGWFRSQVDLEAIARDPWLSYAATHAEPSLASDLPRRGPSGSRAADGEGFNSSLLVPAHSPPGHSRIGLLALGSSRPGFFEAEGIGRFRIGARALAAELHDWWNTRLRREMVARSRITSGELELLHHERLGHGSKHIARVLNTTESAIDSRFQRLNAKLGTTNRRVAARLVMACGLLPL